MNPLLAKPTEPQSQLLEVIYKGRERAGGPWFHPIERQDVEPHRVGREVDAWPIFQFVEAVLYREHGLDARSVIATTPSIRFGAGQGRYGWIQVDRPAAALQQDDKVRLTVAGMAQVVEASAEVEAFIATLALLVEREQGFAPHPSEVQKVEVWSGEVRKRLEQRWVLGDDGCLSALREVLAREPSTWHCPTKQHDDGRWTTEVSPFVRDYSRVSTPSEYVDRLVGMIGLPSPPLAPLHESSLSLPEAIDYLNAVWRLGVGNGDPLFRITRAEAAAKLALECATVDELESRLSAFGSILSQARLPGSSQDQKLMEVRTKLQQLLDADAAARASKAIDDLRAVVALRAWRQHPGTDKRAREAGQRLGVALPSEDWGATWTQLVARSVAALATIREELELTSAAT